MYRVMEKQFVVYTYIQWNIIYNINKDCMPNVDELPKHSKWKKLDIRSHILYDSNYMNYL